MIKRLLSKVGFIALFISFSYAATAHVALDYPVGGETFIIGENITIEWHIVAPHNTLNWDLYFSPDGGVTWDTIQLDIPTSQLSYVWEIPDIETTLGRVRVIQDNEDQNYLDISMDFSIVPNMSPPSLDAPAADITIECNAQNQQAAIQAWLNDNGGAAATNYCGELVWTNDYAGYTNDCGATGNTLVIFEAVDECGMITTNATLTIADSSPPVIDVPASSLTVETNGQGNLTQLNQWLNTKGGANASDVCGQVTWTNNYTSLSDGCGTTGAASVTFTATDECGNSSITIATFSVVDQTPPVFSKIANDTIFTCDASDQQNKIQQWLSIHGGAQASDVGSAVVWSHNYSALSDGCGATGSASVQFTATDECGNSAITTASITIVDNVAPSINTSPQNQSLGCTGTDQQNEIQLWLESHGGAQATDICSNVSWTHNYSGLSDGCSSTGAAIVIFTASDQCGNSTTTIATISVEDKTAPVIDQPAHDTTVVCGTDDQAIAILNWLNNQGGAQASDVCGSVTWANDFTLVSDSCGPLGSHNVVFTATDNCGNVASIQAIITIQDSLPTSNAHVEQFECRIYPNPAKEKINVVFDNIEFGSIQLTLFDSYGKPHWSDECKASETTIPLSSYTPGVYFVQIRTAKGMYTQKVIIN